MFELETIASKLAVVAGVLTSLGILWASRAVLVRAWRGVVFVWKAPGKLLAGSELLAARFDVLAADVSEVKMQVQTNGGASLKDSILRTEIAVRVLQAGQDRHEAYREYDFWARQEAAVEMDSTGQVHLVSEAACRLFRVSDPGKLERLSWLQYLDRQQVGEFIHSLRESGASTSAFRFTIRIRADDGEDRGVWEFRASPIGVDPVNYSGYFRPAGPLSRGIAERAGWEGGAAAPAAE